MKLTNAGRRLVVFMTFGDGYINRNGYLSIRHSLLQKEYLDWKYELLRKNGISTTEPYFVSNNDYGSYEIRTKSYHFIKLYRRVIYPKFKNIANRKLLNKFTPLALAIWYMDDGGLSQKKKNGKVHANDLMLNTMLPKKDNQIIIDYFKDVWDINFTQVKNRGRYRLRCGTREARKFIEIVKPYVEQVECMKHKLNIKQ